MKTICIAHGERLNRGKGGTYRTVSIVKALANHGLDIHLVAPASESPTEVSLPQEVHLHTVPMKTQHVLGQLPRAIRVVRTARTVADEHQAILQFERGTLAGVASLLGCRDYVVDLHDFGFDGQLYHNLPISKLFTRIVYNIEKRGVNSASAVVSVSNGMSEVVRREWGVSDSDRHVLPNCVDDSIFHYAYDEPQEERSVAFFGALNYHISFEKLFAIYDQLDVSLHIVGDGLRRSEVEEYAQTRENVTVHGYLDDPEAYRVLSRVSVCVVPLREAERDRALDIEDYRHIKAIHYAALGKAIASDCDETAKLLGDRDAALVSDPNQPAELIDNTARLLDEPGLRQTMGKNARQAAYEYTWNQQIGTLLEIYNHVDPVM